MKKSRIAARLLLCAAAVVVLGAAGRILAASRDALMQKVALKSGEAILKTWYTDFDGDGTKELFAAVGEEDSCGLWFAGNKEVKKLPASGSFYYQWTEPHKGICRVSKKQKLFVIESGAFGSGSTSHCYYVRNGHVKTVKKAGEGLVQLKGNQFAVHPSAFDLMTEDAGYGLGHTYKRYYLKWTGTAFKEYRGTRISTAALKKYTGAAAILKKAKQKGFSVGRIYRRANGMINVNLHSRSGSTRNNENLTLRVSGKKVSLVKLVQKSSTWIGYYSYGGIYQASGF